MMMMLLAMKRPSGLETLPAAAGMLRNAFYYPSMNQRQIMLGRKEGREEGIRHNPQETVRPWKLFECARLTAPGTPDWHRASPASAL